MAGGIILMGVFSFFLSVPAAMVLHGIAQTLSNGSRVFIYKRHLCLPILIPYALGSFVTLALFLSLSLIPNKGVIFLVMGSFPFLALLLALLLELALPKKINLNIEDKPVAFLCGLIVTAVQLLAGASGPILDIFYISSTLNRYEILGTKAITQSLGHIIKLFYYTLFLDFAIALNHWLIIGIIGAAILGNWIASLVIPHINDASFKKAGRLTILVIGTIYIAKGLQEFLC